MYKNHSKTSLQQLRHESKTANCEINSTPPVLHFRLSPFSPPSTPRYHHNLYHTILLLLLQMAGFCSSEPNFCSNNAQCSTILSFAKEKYDKSDGAGKGGGGGRGGGGAGRESRATAMKRIISLSLGDEGS